ncbi:putative leucine-rich protein, related [Monocercomonoides exilis]|uniref:putative leucine-rich protein, related n=1 Tax=Monocercomonoides exilis TaxID=2049356 RepID=UPI003559943C|nr:putative leucine-rich protein, related [Monocercomonoides exilis]|eukprot:MONOS_6461.1-p1 / transcript=MONOS_6461.1 / gene=MONOS_6461 / organism=Monocercomonoides_exilis_PA203 / gene_product=leucine-rich protein, related / transcript_product=leucine-rich protein, related / location=Mono_scaffold00203:62500-65170(+) / protein_length=704 / sequence_SO=supercontig / SO=protein_coding / is_pseudo=false
MATLDAINRKKSKTLDPESVIRVINEELVAKSVAKQKIIVDKLSLTPSIILSFKKIRKIENLDGYSKLTTLKLDNNNITVIENLSSLVSLELLDLSFNQISEIPTEGGLETLVNLKELSLFSNKIKDITPLAQLTSLQILSVGDNEIDEMEKIKPLRTLKHLQSLTLIGNPLTKDSDYATFVLAYLSYPLLQAGSSSSASSASSGAMMAALDGGEKGRGRIGGGSDGGMMGTAGAMLSETLGGGNSGSSGAQIGGGSSASGGAGGMVGRTGAVLEAANDPAVVGAGGISTGMITMSTPVDISLAAAERGGLVSLRGGQAIRTLAYLDYKMVNVDAVIRARELYGEDLAKLEQEDLNAELAKEASAALEKQKELARAANFEGLDVFFQEMVENDQEYQTKLKYVRVVDACLAEYRTECAAVIDEFKQYMAGQLDLRRKEEEEMNYAMNVIEEQAVSTSQEILAKFSKLRKGITAQLEAALVDGPTSANDSLLSPETMKQLEDANEALLKELMEIEEHRVEQAESILDQYGAKLKEMFATTKDRIQLDFQNLVRLETREAELMAADAMRESERISAPGGGGSSGSGASAAGASSAADGSSSASAAGGAHGAGSGDEDVMSAEEKAVLSDKPSLQQSLKNSSEFRQAKIHEKEDEIVDREKKTRVDMENKAREEEHKKNRTRLIEIWHHYDSVNQFIQQIMQEDTQR